MSRAEELLTILESEAIESEDSIDTITFDVPAIMRLCELMREAKLSDADLHVIIERLIKLSKSVDIITMSDYDKIYAGVISKEDAGDSVEPEKEEEPAKEQPEQKSEEEPKSDEHQSETEDKPPQSEDDDKMSEYYNGNLKRVLAALAD